MGFYFGKCKVCIYIGIYNIVFGIMYCSCVLVIEIRDIIVLNLDILMEYINYFIDNKVVFGYLNNNIRYFYIYVSNRDLIIYGCF